MKRLVTVKVLKACVIRNLVHLFLTCLLVIGTTGTVHAMGGIEGTFEYAINAPWRMQPDPKPDGQMDYGPIPIQISIHDAMHAGALDVTPHPLDYMCEDDFDPFLPPEFFGLGNFCQITVYEEYYEDIPPEERKCELCMLIDTDFGPGKKMVMECGDLMLCSECETIRESMPESLGAECKPDNKSTIKRSFSTTYLLEDLAEIEMTKGAWKYPTTSDPPEYDICRSWNGEDCESFRDISQTSEWHALLWYEPLQYPKPGSVISLKVEMKLMRRPWISCNGDISGDHPHLDEKEDYMITLRNYLRVYLGDEPLPRFNNSLYGDLHYHSQGTDNEGESCANYRGVIRAMGAMGLDFLFATEHASSSEQIIDADLALDLHDIDLHDAETTGGVLRDMSKKRFAFNHGLIYGENGVNKEAALNASGNRMPQGFLSHGLIPQIFLAGEIDVIPEVETAPFQPISYGNGLEYSIEDFCDDWNYAVAGLNSCPADKLWEPVQGGYLIKDVQGINYLDYGREHMIYLPKNSDLELPIDPWWLEEREWCELCTKIDFDIGPKIGPYPVSGTNEEPHCNGPLLCSECETMRESMPESLEAECHPVEAPPPPIDKTFIASWTGKYGGASRRLKHQHGLPPVLPEIEKKSYAFIAHPLDATSGGKGPGSPPWSKSMLRQAWASPAVLGLQFWNGDSRLSTDIRYNTCGNICEDDDCFGRETGYERVEGWFCPKPVDYLRQWLKYGADPFELRPYCISTGRWQEFRHIIIPNTWEGGDFKPYESVEYKLRHGAYVWDTINHWGLDINKTRQLSDWLAPGEPRRFFFGGGSDAHGALNYHRSGYLLGTESTDDGAIGKPRNLVFAGPPKIMPPQFPTDVVIARNRLGGLQFNENEESLSMSGYSVEDLKNLEVNSGNVFEDPDMSVISPSPGSTSPGSTSPGSTSPGSTSPGSTSPGSTSPGSTSSPVAYCYTQEDVIGALREGRFSVTDGPALRIAVDQNLNGKIDDGDIQMGGIVHLCPDKKVNLLVQWKSTPEFGPVTDIHLYIGVQSSRISSNRSARTYAPYLHGTREPEVPSNWFEPVESGYLSGGRWYSKMKDGYWQDPTGFLTVLNGNDASFEGTRARSLDLNLFQVVKDTPGDRFFIRAFARTDFKDPTRCTNPTSGDLRAGLCVRRYAYANPIWVIKDNNDNCDPTSGQSFQEPAVYYKDEDGDGFGEDNDSRTLYAPEGVYTATQGGDYNDKNLYINLMAKEACNGVDDDCDGRIDEEGAMGCKNYFMDSDGDGYGVSNDSLCLCAPAGDYTATEASTTVDTQSIPLVAGWNWVSFNVIPDDMSLEGFFGSDLDNLEQVATFSLLAIDLGPPLGWQGQTDLMSRISEGEMYKIKSKTDFTLHVTGTPLDPASISIPLAQGWTWIGYTPDSYLPFEEALGSILNDLYQVASFFALKIKLPPLGFQGGLNEMCPGVGYKVQMNSPGTLTYPGNP